MNLQTAHWLIFDVCLLHIQNSLIHISVNCDEIAEMTFVLQGKKQFLSPAIETKAIQKLAEYMTVYNKEDLTTNQLVPFVLICLVPARLPRL
jgi:hypothetical protein